MAACCTGHCAFWDLCGPDEYSSGEESLILGWSALRCVPNVLHGFLKWATAGEAVTGNHRPSTRAHANAEPLGERAVCLPPD